MGFKTSFLRMMRTLKRSNVCMHVSSLDTMGPNAIPNRFEKVSFSPSAFSSSIQVNRFHRKSAIVKVEVLVIFVFPVAMASFPLGWLVARMSLYRSRNVHSFELVRRLPFG